MHTSSITGLGAQITAADHLLDPVCGERGRLSQSPSTPAGRSRSQSIPKLLSNEDLEKLQELLEHGRLMGAPAAGADWTVRLIQALRGAQYGAATDLPPARLAVGAALPCAQALQARTRDETKRRVGAIGEAPDDAEKLEAVRWLGVHLVWAAAALSVHGRGGARIRAPARPPRRPARLAGRRLRPPWSVAVPDVGRRGRFRPRRPGVAPRHVDQRRRIVVWRRLGRDQLRRVRLCDRGRASD